jgi:hypothetical protein
MSKQRISIVTTAIVRHVLDDGGFLGVSWPLYVGGPKLAGHEYIAAMRLAESRCYRQTGAYLHQIAQYNYDNWGREYE